MTPVLLITIRFHEGRYHGVGDDPPSPARLFQALVAGVGLGGPLGVRETKALEWLEQRCEYDPPLIASPRMSSGQPVTNYMPNNDLDAVGRDPRRIGGIRTPKIIRPRLFDRNIPFMYAWTFDVDEESKFQAEVILTIAERLYQFGRGVDLAWAWGELLDSEQLESRLSSYSGIVYHPSKGGSGRTLACAQRGSLQTLTARYAACSQRFKKEGQGNAAKRPFSQPPKSRFRQVAYDSPPSRRVFDLRQPASDTSFAVWPLARISKLAVALRDGAVARLRGALPDRSTEIERFLVGRKANGADEGPTALRVRILPLPSIGHHHADRGIRRVLVEVPAGCPLRADDVHWAFSGLELVDPETGEVLGVIATPTEDEGMLSHYGVGERGFRVWRTVTPVALPESVARRRIDPSRIPTEAKYGTERAAEQARAAGAVIHALRFAEIRTWVESIHLQREPFEAYGARVEEFAPGTRFAKERFWHVEITFREPIMGPVVIGDGRFLGLGVMAPVPLG
jgi:CRISPR-associated protein Csb2